MLVLSRSSNLPTVWSNALTAFAFGVQPDPVQAATILLGSSLLYTGGMFLNDAADSDFDKKHRAERPIPQGILSLRFVSIFGFLFLAAGLIPFIRIGGVSSTLAILLVISILLYTFIHKRTSLSPVIMAACRVFLFLACSCFAQGILTGYAIWTSLALGAYIVGLSYIAKSEATQDPLSLWPIVFLLAPVIRAGIIHDAATSLFSIAASLVFILWLGYSLSFLFQTKKRNVGYSVSCLLSGIVWCDLLATNGSSLLLTLTLCLLFLLTRLTQRLIPAT